jgi:hypothetical protein
VANARQVRRSVHAHAATGVITSICGWLCALGAAAILTELVGVLGIPLGVGRNRETSMGAQGALLLLSIHLLAYGCGGYVAGRAVRSSGALQGIAVWGRDRGERGRPVQPPCAIERVSPGSGR